LGGDAVSFLEAKKWIDSATYEQLLYRWRYGPTGDEMFRGDIYRYYKAVMEQHRIKNPVGHIRASKAIDGCQPKKEVTP
jgi:hypothetical protein